MIFKGKNQWNFLETLKIVVPLDQDQSDVSKGQEKKSLSEGKILNQKCNFNLFLNWKKTNGIFFRFFVTTKITP